MDESLLELLPVYGLPVLALVVGLGCLGLPAPSSLFILLGGSFAAAGDFNVASVFVTCFIAAVAADNLGYTIGRTGGSTLHRRFGRSMGKAHALLEGHGGKAIFLSRWLVAPLGPAINLVAGAARMSWHRFLLFDIAGELVWVVLYMGLGALFSSAILELADLIANASASIAFAVVAAGIGWVLFRRLRAQPG